MKKIASYIDHTFLKKNAKLSDIRKICEEAIEYGFKGVCLYPKFFPFAKSILKNKNISLVAVVDFPKGRKSPYQKALETKKAIEKGADEIDMVMNIEALKRKDYGTVLASISSVIAESCGKCVKVIIETCLLEDDEKKIACALAKASGAQYVKTSTGFSHGGATIEDIVLMKKIVGDDVKIKASGGIRSYEMACKMIQAGALRIGTSSSVKIVQEEKQKRKK